MSLLSALKYYLFTLPNENMNSFINKLSVTGIQTVLISLGAVLVTDVANAATLTEVNPINIVGSEELFKIESRAGRPGDTSVALSDDGTQGSSPVVWRTNWLNGQAYNFQLLYNSATGITTMNFDGSTQSYTHYLGSPFSFDYIQVFAQSKTDQVAEGTYITLDIQTVNGMDSDVFVSAIKPALGNDQVGVFFGSDQSIAELTGSISIGWLGEENNPRENNVGSRVQLHLSGYGSPILIPPIESVPEPSSIMGLFTIVYLATVSSGDRRK
jgi:hypothetical protein